MASSPHVLFCFFIELMVQTDLQASIIPSPAVPPSDDVRLGSVTPSQAQDVPEAKVHTPMRLAEVNCTALTWAEEIETNWTKVITRDDLLNLRNFFQQGMDLAVVEEKVCLTLQTLFILQQ